MESPTCTGRLWVLPDDCHARLCSSLPFDPPRVASLQARSRRFRAASAGCRTGGCQSTETTSSGSSAQRPSGQASTPLCRWVKGLGKRAGAEHGGDVVSPGLILRAAPSHSAAAPGWERPPWVQGRHCCRLLSWTLPRSPPPVPNPTLPPPASQPLQGSAADLAKRAMLGLWSRLLPGKARLVHMIHDELLIEVAAPELHQVCSGCVPAVVGEVVPHCDSCQSARWWAHRSAPLAMPPPGPQACPARPAAGGAPGSPDPGGGGRR